MIRASIAGNQDSSSTYYPHSTLPARSLSSPVPLLSAAMDRRHFKYVILGTSGDVPRSTSLWGTRYSMKAEGAGIHQHRSREGLIVIVLGAHILTRGAARWSMSPDSLTIPRRVITPLDHGLLTTL